MAALSLAILRAVLKRALKMSGAPRLPVGAPGLTPRTARMAAGPGAAVQDPLVSYVLVKNRLTRGPSRVLSSQRCRAAIDERMHLGRTKDDRRHGFRI